MSHFNMLVFPAIVLPLTVYLQVDMATVLGLSFWMYLLFGCTALPWGMIADRWSAGPLMLMRIYYAGAGISAFTAALCLNRPFALTIALAAIGLFSGIYHPIGLGIISKEIKRVSVGMGYNGMFGNLGLASAPANGRRDQLAVGTPGGLFFSRWNEFFRPIVNRNFANANFWTIQGSAGKRRKRFGRCLYYFARCDDVGWSCLPGRHHHTSGIF